MQEWVVRGMYIFFFFLIKKYFLFKKYFSLLNAFVSKSNIFWSLQKSFAIFVR